MKKILILALFLSLINVLDVFAATGYTGNTGYKGGNGYQGNEGYKGEAGYQPGHAGYKYTGGGYQPKDSKYRKIDPSEIKDMPDLKNKLQQPVHVDQLTEQGQEWLDDHPDEAKQTQQLIEQQSKQYSK